MCGACATLTNIEKVVEGLVVVCSWKGERAASESEGTGKINTLATGLKAKDWASWRVESGLRVCVEIFWMDN